MPSVLFYIFKLSVAFAAIYLFYQLILRRLTFYNWNRWYLIIYTAIAFLIPFINITPVLEKNDWSDSHIVNWVPSIAENTPAQNLNDGNAMFNFSVWGAIMPILIFGAFFLFARLVIQFISFNQMRKKAIPFTDNGLTIYQVNEKIIPFSFGNSIFINKGLHSEDELREIIRHEFIHVKQKHSIDIVWGEFLCILNWYNPFVWLLKRSIRQNLEFIADNKVIENGINKKEYQYLLLKVIGNSQFSIATQFNFSSLKKRIAMMNKTKSAKRQLGRFLFLFPVLAIILLSFRKSFTDGSIAKMNFNTPVFTDTIPDVTILNSKGYYIDIKDDNGNCTVVVKDKDKKEVKRLLLTEWNSKTDYYEDLYGEILSPTTAIVEEKIKARNPAIRTVTIKGNTATVTLKNGKTEVYTLSIRDEKRAFEVRCGIAEEVAIAPTEAITEVRAVTAETMTEPVEERIAKTVTVPAKTTLTVPVEERITKTITVPSKASLGTIADDFEITGDKAVMHLKNGKTEEYNLNNPKERETFEKKFGKIISLPVEITTAIEPVTVIAEQSESPVLTTVSPSKEVRVIDTENELVVEEEVLFTITKKTTAEELESLVKKMKEKGYELKFTNKDYNDGVLTQVSGTVKYKDSNSSFSATDFSKVTISSYHDGDKIRFRISIGTKKGIS